MTDQSDEALIAAVERESGLAPGLLASLVDLEARFPDLNARGVRQEIFRSIAEILDAAADRADAPQ